MIIITHFLATLILLKIFSVSDIGIIFWSFFFGIAIDFDEIIFYYNYWKSSKSFRGFVRKSMKSAKRRNWFDEFGGLVISFLISVFLGSFVPFLSNLAHCIMDWSCSFESQPLAPFYNKLKTRGFVKHETIQEVPIIISLTTILIILL